MVQVTHHLSRTVRIQILIRLQSLYNTTLGTSLEVQWLRLHTHNAGGPGSIPGRGTRSHIPAATKILHTATKHAATKIPRATTKTRSSQNK